MTQPTQPSPRRTYRQAGAVVPGLLFAVALVVLAIAGGGRDLGLELLFVAAALLVLAVVVWPKVTLDQHGVHLENVGLVTHVPWHLVDDCETRWNLQVWTLTKAYTAWAISSTRRGHLPQHHMMAASLNPANIGRPDKIDASAEAGVERHNRKVHAASVAESIESAKLEYDQGVADGSITPTEGDVRRTVSPVSVGLLGTALVCAVAGVLLV